MLKYSPLCFMCLGLILMPQKILCVGCSAILYEGFELESPQEIIAGKNGRCPSCGRRLEFLSNTIKIMPLNNAEISE